MSLDVTRQWLRDNTARRFDDSDKVYALVDEAISQYRSLKPKIAEHMSADKTIQALLCLHGTLPVVFNGATFNIPVVFWFPRQFPSQPPMAYVTPTHTMVVKVSKHVDERGRIYHPYLAAWSTEEGSTLLELFASLIAVFSVEPPVYSRPPGYLAAAINPGFVGQRVGAATGQQPQQQQHAGTVSMPVLPQNSGLYAKQQMMQQQMLNNKRPMSALETELASVTVPMNSSLLQTHAPVNSSASPKPPTSTSTPPPPAAAAAVPQQTLAGNFPAGLSSPISGQTYSFNPIAGRPPIPITNPTSAPNTPGKTTFDTNNPTTTSPTSMASAPVSAASLGADHAGSVTALAAAVIAARMQLPVSDNESSSGQSNLWSDADSDHSDAANLDLNDPPAEAAAAVAVAAAAASTDSTISPDTLQQYQKQKKQLPLPQPVSSLLDSSPVDDPMKRLVGYQLAIYDRVSSAINKSREIHTRVNRELLDQSANLNSGAGVISEERKQLMESQKQLTANISVLESKLAELGAKKREFPEDSRVVDVAGVFRGVGMMEQLFDLAAEIAAIDDTLYLLGKGLNDGRVSLSVYMRQVRKLAQQQFLAKALALKIRGLSNLN